MTTQSDIKKLAQQMVSSMNSFDTLKTFKSNSCSPLSILP